VGGYPPPRPVHSQIYANFANGFSRITLLGNL
jgi:hypothetical protein